MFERRDQKRQYLECQMDSGRAIVFCGGRCIEIVNSGKKVEAHGQVTSLYCSTQRADGVSCPHGFTSRNKK